MGQTQWERALKADQDFERAYVRRVKQAYNDGVENGNIGALQWVARLIAEAKGGGLDARAQSRLDLISNIKRLDRLVVDLSVAPDAAAVQNVLAEI